MNDEQRVNVSLRRTDLYKLVQGECPLHVSNCAQNALENKDPPPPPKEHLEYLIERLTSWYEKACEKHPNDGDAMSIKFTAYDVFYDDEDRTHIAIAIKETSEEAGL